MVSCFRNWIKDEMLCLMISYFYILGLFSICVWLAYSVPSCMVSCGIKIAFPKILLSVCVCAKGGGEGVCLPVLVQALACACTCVCMLVCVCMCICVLCVFVRWRKESHHLSNNVKVLWNPLQVCSKACQRLAQWCLLVLASSSFILYDNSYPFLYISYNVSSIVSFTVTWFSVMLCIFTRLKGYETALLDKVIHYWYSVTLLGTHMGYQTILQTKIMLAYSSTVNIWRGLGTLVLIPDKSFLPWFNPVVCYQG